MNNILISSVLLVVLLAPANAESGSDALLRRGQEVSMQYMKELKGKLVQAMSGGGPRQALDVCGTEAAKLNASFRMRFDDVRDVRRISEKYRNPANKPGLEDAKILKAFSTGSRDKNAPGEYLLKEGEGEVIFYKPIMVQAQCLACHGEKENLAPGIRQSLASRYPDDRATGYHVGDFRGLVRVTLSLQKVD